MTHSHSSNLIDILTNTKSPITLPVAQLNILIRDWIEGCPPLNDIWISGEIGNFRRMTGSQRYFTLTESDSTIQCVIFDATERRFDGVFKDGVSVLARGKVRYFNRRGTLQFQIGYMMPKGAGTIAENLALLKQKLTDNGVFDTASKKPLPKYPQRLALITASESAAMADVTALLKTHAPIIEIVAIQTVMQGNGCPPSVVDAIDWANGKSNAIDLILIARGGGSFEDLLPFNDEHVVRKIHESRIPIATAIGHEIDSTLSDLAADQHFSTPSAAALKIGAAFEQLPKEIDDALKSMSQTLATLTVNTRQEIDDLAHAADDAITLLQRHSMQTIDGLIRELHLLSPLRKLSQGFSIARSKNREILRSIYSVLIDDTLEITFSDGTVVGTVKEIIQCQKPNQNQ